MFLFSKEQCQALYETLSELTGGGPESVFAWDGTDDVSDPYIGAWLTVFKACGKQTPHTLIGIAPISRAANGSANRKRIGGRENV